MKEGTEGGLEREKGREGREGGMKRAK